MSAETSLRELVADLVESSESFASLAELPEIWLRIDELGLSAVGVAEDNGGSGGTLSDLAVVVESLGQRGVGVPLIEVATARWVIGESGIDLGPCDVPIVVIEPGHTQGDRISVPWGRHADVLIVYPLEGSPLAYRLDSPSVSIEHALTLAGEPYDGIDLAGASSVVFASAPSREAVEARLGLLWAAALSGAVRGTYELTRDFVRTRAQFGSPLIKIPAVASALATIRTQLLQADSALAGAVESTERDSHPLPAVAAARIVTAQSATQTAQLAHQLHGAIGVTKEYGLHRLTLRLWAWRDAVLSERDWCVGLGALALDGGEDALWESLTAVHAPM